MMNLKLWVHDALSGIEKDHWLKAIKEELDSLRKKNTWVLIERKGVPEKDILTTKCFFNKKFELDNACRYKAELVIIRDFQDKTKSETYSPVMRLMDFQFLIAIANRFQL